MADLATSTQPRDGAARFGAAGAMATSAQVFDAYIERSWRTNAQRQRDKGVEFVIGRRDGVRLWDLEGRRSIIDCGTAGGVHSLGHRHPEVLAALRRALDEGRDTGLWALPNAEYLALQDRLAALAPCPSLDRSVVTLCSTLSVDVASMFAFRVTGRQAIAAYRYGYHGHTGFAAMVTGSLEEGVIEHYNLPKEHSRFFQRYGDLASLEAVLTSDIAALIVEPMDYETFEPAEARYLQGAQKLCRERGIVFIIDETRTGLGRSGRLWACEHSDVEPDMMITGKGLSGGLYPTSAVLMRRDIYDRCMNEHRFAYISSLGGNEISCLVGAKVLEISARPETLAHAASIGDRLRERLEEVCARHPDLLTHARGRGCAVNVGLTPRVSGRALYRAMFEAGVLCHSVSEIDPPAIKFFPPIVITEADVEEIAGALDRAVVASAHAAPRSKADLG